MSSAKFWCAVGRCMFWERTGRSAGVFGTETQDFATEPTTSWERIYRLMAERPLPIIDRAKTIDFGRVYSVLALIIAG